MRRIFSPTLWLPVALLGPIVVLALIYVEIERRREEARRIEAVREEQAVQGYLSGAAELHDEFLVSLRSVEYPELRLPAVQSGEAGQELMAEVEPLCRRVEGARVQAEHYLSSLRGRQVPTEARQLHFWLERELVAYLDYVVALDLFCRSKEVGYLDEVVRAWGRGADAGREVVGEFARLAPETVVEPALWALRPTPEPARPTRRVGAELANVRTCPRLDCQILATLEQGRVVTILESVEGEEVLGTSVWHRVSGEGLPEASYMHESTLEAVSSGEPGGSEPPPDGAGGDR